MSEQSRLITGDVGNAYPSLEFLNWN